MKPNVMLTIASLLSILFFTFHLEVTARSPPNCLAKSLRGTTKRFAELLKQLVVSMRCDKRDGTHDCLLSFDPQSGLVLFVADLLYPVGRLPLFAVNSEFAFPFSQ